MIKKNHPSIKTIGKISMSVCRGRTFLNIYICMLSIFLMEGLTKSLYGDNKYNILNKENFNYATDLKAISYFSASDVKIIKLPLIPSRLETLLNMWRK